MKLLLIKIGKAIKVLKHDGFFMGSTRIMKYLINFFKTIFSRKSGDILIITGGLGDSALYMSRHYADELNNNGLKCSTTVIDDPFLLKHADNFKVFIFHRTLFTTKIEKFINKIKESKKEIIFDTDDLVFDSRYLNQMDYLKEMNVLEKKQYQKGVGEEILNDPFVKVCTTTTSYLAEKLKERNKQVFIVPNKLSDSDLKIAEEINKIRNSKFEIRNSIRLGYFSGTISHNKDFAVITDVLIEIMDKFPQVALFLVGPLDLESSLNKFKNRIKQLPYVPRHKHFENIAKVDINLAPLEIGNPFCESKSELKFFEAGILGVPTIAAATQTFIEAIEDGVDGFIANSTRDWIEKLQKLIENKDLRIEMGKKAREKTLDKYTTKSAKNESYNQFLRNKL